MPHICLHEDNFYFPPVDEADEEGLLLIGGAVTPSRVLVAYAKGIFPWYNDDSLPLWWTPDPRFVLFPDELHISRSMQKLLAKNAFTFRTNTAFEQVINACAEVERKDQDGTWITEEMKAVYLQLHRDGYAHSAETWKDTELVGGMYGIRLGNVFFGESMFSKISNASKFAFISYVKQVRENGISLIDCQVHTEHVETLGARLIDRDEYIQLLKELI